MKKLIFIALIGITALAVLLIFLWVNDSAPAGWVTYQNRELGFALQHPEEAEVLLYSGLPEATFVVKGPGWEDETDLVYDGIWFHVRKEQLHEMSSLQSIAAERGLQVTETTLAGFPGYQYQLEEDEGSPIVTVVLISPEPGYLFEISYWLEDPSNQGYEQVVEQMLTFFRVEKGNYLLVTFIVGGMFVFAFVAGITFLWVSRPNKIY